MQIDLDVTDLRLLDALQDNARLTTAELAQMTQLSQSPCWRRVRRLEEAKVITGYQARLDRRALGFGVLAFVLVSIDHQNEATSQAFEQAVRALPEVVMLHAISGPSDFILMVVARDLDSYGELLQRHLHRLPGVKQVQTHFSLQEFKTAQKLPVPL